MTRIGWFLVTGVLALASLAGPSAADEPADETTDETTYVLDLHGPDPVEAGSAVSVSLTATAPDGSPVNGLYLRFVRTGPGPATWASCSVEQLTRCGVTTGGAAYTVVEVGLHTGAVEVRAEVYGPEGALLAEVGPVRIEVYGSTTCSFARARCSPLRAKLMAGDGRPRRDVLNVDGPWVWRSSRVVLMRRTSGTWAATGRLARLGPTGNCRFSVPDRNGRAVTKYRATILPRGGSRGDVTSVVRLR